MWLNDPNGLVYFAGEYHLFYQHHPFSSVWGPMHWGHAVSPDLVNWQHLPIALYPDEHGAIFSGSAVVDWENTAGFGREALVLIFTHAAEHRQAQSLAYATDRGRTWTKYAGNPVLLPPNGLRDFRDPKVFWHGARPGGHWVMALAAGDAIRFYTSPDLRRWQQSGAFGPGHGAMSGVWETPDLFELPLDGGPATRWVLSVGVGRGGPAGGSATQYFVGRFDGQTFTSDNPREAVLWADFGADFYAAQSWSDAPDGQRVWLGWLNNWRYANLVPTAPWRGAFSVPRELSLASTAAGLRLVQQPIAGLRALRGQPQQWRDLRIEGRTPVAFPDGAYEIDVEFELAPQPAERLGLRLFAAGQAPVTIAHTPRLGTLTVERRECPGAEFSPDFGGVHTAPLALDGGALRLQAFVDRSSVEVFAGDGQVVLTELVFPCPGDAGFELFAEGGAAAVRSLSVYPLGPAEFAFPGARPPNGVTQAAD
jgi:fructan beta-fructosidase